MDQTAFLHLDNKIATVQQEAAQRMDGAETRMTVQVSSVRSEMSGFMQEIRGELKALNASNSKETGTRDYRMWLIPILISLAELGRDLFHH